MSDIEAELLTVLHRRWIETRDARDGDKFALVLAQLTKNGARERFPSVEVRP